MKVVFSGKNRILWHIEIAGKEEKLVFSEPTDDDWKYLVAVVEKWYVRRRIPYKYVELLRSLIKK